MAKSWEKYGIHALETLYPIVGPGFTSIQNLGDKNINIGDLIFLAFNLPLVSHTN